MTPLESRADFQALFALDPFQVAVGGLAASSLRHRHGRLQAKKSRSVCCQTRGHHFIFFCTPSSSRLSAFSLGETMADTVE
jgi:hypothetical protein